MSTYKVAYDALRERLAGLDMATIAELSGARVLGPDRIGLRCLGADYVIRYPDGLVLEADGQPAPEHDAILLLLYLTESTGRTLDGAWVAFEQLPGGSGYSASFRGRVVMPLMRTFGPHPKALLAAAAGLDGERLDLGDASVRLPALPRVPVAYVVWGGDDEFPPSANVVFDASVEGYLDAEAVTVLAELATRRLVGAANLAAERGERT
jgi:Domain of unknown function (DUF3786)